MILVELVVNLPDDLAMETGTGTLLAHVWGPST
jgi:hypothetical protein